MSSGEYHQDSQGLEQLPCEERLGKQSLISLGKRWLWGPKEPPVHTYRDITETEESGSSQGLMTRAEETICIKMENKKFSLDVSSDWNILRPLPK